MFIRPQVFKGEFGHLSNITLRLFVQQSVNCHQSQGQVLQVQTRKLLFSRAAVELVVDTFLTINNFLTSNVPSFDLKVKGKTFFNH